MSTVEKSKQYLFLDEVGDLSQEGWVRLMDDDSVCLDGVFSTSDLKRVLSCLERVGGGSIHIQDTNP